MEQNQNYDTGLQSLITIATFYGIHADIENIQHEFMAGKEKANIDVPVIEDPEEFVKFFKNKKDKVCVVKHSVSRLIYMGYQRLRCQRYYNRAMEHSLLSQK